MTCIRVPLSDVRRRGSWQSSIVVWVKEFFICIISRCSKGTLVVNEISDLIIMVMIVIIIMIIISIIEPCKVKLYNKNHVPNINSYTSDILLITYSQTIISHKRSICYNIPKVVWNTCKIVALTLRLLKEFDSRQSWRWRYICLYFDHPIYDLRRLLGCVLVWDAILRQRSLRYNRSS